MELQRLGVEAIEFSGEKRAFNVPILGKGCVGIVVIAYLNSKKIALKIRRVDADRSRMQQEAKMLKKANSVSIGPKFLGVSENFLLMEFVDGDLLPLWLEKRREEAVIRKVFRELLQQSWCLDKIGLDHGELSHAPKHIIIDLESRPFLVDFETASVNRRASNVTSICHFLFVGGMVAKMLTERLSEIDKNTLIEALRLHKAERSRESFERILRLCVL